MQALDRKQYTPIIAMPSDGPLKDALEAIGVKVLVDRRLQPFLNTPTARHPHYTNLMGLLHCSGAVRAAAKICNDVKPDIVHINTSVSFHLAVGAKRAGVKSVFVHARENWDLHWFDLRNRYKDRVIEQCVDCIIAICREAGVRFAPKQLDRISVVHNWPDFEGRERELNIYSTYGIEAGKKIILAPSGRLKIKGALDAVKAMQYVQDTDAILLVLGGQPDTHPLKMLVRRIFTSIGIRTYGLKVDYWARRLGGRVVLAPWSLNMMSIIKQSTIVLCPFNHPHFSKAAIEAGALSRPVIITDDAFARDAVIDGESGVLIPGGDSKVLAGQINELLADQRKCARMGANAQAYIEKKFSKQVAMRKITAIYSQAKRGGEYGSGKSGATALSLVSNATAGDDR